MKITYNTKANGPNPKNIRTQEWWEEDANEVKEVVNANDTIDVGMAYPIPMDKIQGRSFGTWSQPMTGNIVVDTTNWVEGACASVIWSGSSSPDVVGATVQSYSGVITVAAKYTIYLHYTNNRINVNIFNVEGAKLPDTDAPAKMTINDITDDDGSPNKMTINSII